VLRPVPKYSPLRVTMKPSTISRSSRLEIASLISRSEVPASKISGCGSISAVQERFSWMSMK